VNENIFNSLIIGHSESGDMARAHGMLKVSVFLGVEKKISMAVVHVYSNAIRIRPR
jgi:hypothetical protein